MSSADETEVDSVLWSCLTGVFPSQQKERKLLQVKRLDLDAAKTKLKKAKVAEARAAVSYSYTSVRVHMWRVEQICVWNQTILITVVYFPLLKLIKHKYGWSYL